VADSTSPDQAESGATGDSIFVYAASEGHPVSGNQSYSYNASASSPGASWYQGSPGTLARPITADESAIEFTLQSGSRPIFPEPTMLAIAATVTDSNGNRLSVTSGASSAIRRRAPVSGLMSGGGLPSFFYDNVFNSSGPFVGIYLGAVPLAWKYSAVSSDAPLSAGQSGVFIAKNDGSSGPPAGSRTACYFTYRMQYRDPAGGWVTYDTKYGKTFNDFTQIRVNSSSLICGNGAITSTAGQAGSGGFWAFGVDPRSSRFGLICEGTYPFAAAGLNSPFGGAVGYPTYKPIPGYGRGFLSQDPDNQGGWLDQNNHVTLSPRPDSTGGWFAMSGWPYSTTGGPTTGKIVGNDGKAAGWMCWVATDNAGFPGVQPGMLAQNNTSIPQFYRRYYGDYGGGSGNTHTPEYFADPDGIVRRGMAGFLPPVTNWFPSQTAVGLPMARAFRYVTAVTPTSPQDPSITVYNNATAQVTSQAQSRPYILHRPFRSVAELGYVFSDTPWRNLDFFTAESGCAALLDTCCHNETSDPNALVAGKINLNTRQVTPLKAILAGAYLDDVQPGSSGATGRMDAATAGLLANALIARTTNTANGAGPLRNPSELVGRLVTRTAIPRVSVNGVDKGTLSSGSGFYDGKLSYSGFSGGDWNVGTSQPKLNSPARDVYSAYMSSRAFSTNATLSGSKETATYIQRLREAPIRALSSAGQTRVWNLMVDVVAQTGRFTANAATFDQFRVDGEQRYWVHLAIDRFTGRVVDKQIEVIKE